MRRSLIAAIAAAAVLATTVGTIRLARRSPRRPAAAAAAPVPLDQVAPAPATLPPPKEPPIDRAERLDLLRIAATSEGLVAPSASGTARLTLDPDLQHEASVILTSHHLPEAALVLMDVATGRLLAYATHVEQGSAHDMCVEATAPSASVFKIVTAAALVEDAHLETDTTECYSGGAERITSLDLIEDPKRDRWCSTLAGAMGRSINSIFARLAKNYLAPSQLEAMARRFGYGEPIPFDVPVQPSGLHIPSDPLEFARTAAGFWNTTLSPLEAAELSAIVARRGESVRPRIVDRVVSPTGSVLWSAPPPEPPRRVIAPETADRLTTMMKHTVAEGTCRRAFHDRVGRAFLPSIGVAGKTGTLTDSETARFYTWFTGFAPATASATVEQVAIAVLVVNGPTWEVKANVVARDMLRAYFASKDTPGVTRPALTAIARRRRPR
jgi:penicillin-binding protein A